MVLIARCSSGIGRSTALDFLGEEQEAYATARSPADIETLGERDANIAAPGMIDQGDIDRVIDHIVDEQSHIDCLINDASYGQMGPVGDMPTEKIHDQFNVNAYGLHRLVRTVLPYVRPQGNGTIVSASSVVGHIAFPSTGVYAGSKLALEAITDAFRAEVGEYGTDAVLIEPGPVETQFSNRVEAEVNGNGDEADGLNRSGAYERLYKLFGDSQVLGGSGPGAIPPERVTEDIINTASSAKPRTRYQPGTVARVDVLARFLPDA